ncbi:MAG: phosphoribosylformylglycinamidine synthase I [Candidatus Omnitrophica bacterium]|nr:phosphoribosylformylglycinamidine synthase I [Candidatus Omnitrophota bacterium]
MANKPRVLLLRTAGTNCNVETAFAFEQCGAEVDQVHLQELFAGRVRMQDYHIMALSGGFSYGDDIASGRIFANELRVRLGLDVARFISEKKLIIGICNGFQILVKAGILPGPFAVGSKTIQTATLFNNDSGKFEDRWVHLQVGGQCVWTTGLPESIFIPVAHGEGKFIPADQGVMAALRKNGQIVFSYVNADGTKPGYPENPNGSLEDIAGITDPTGRILGLMPHPERHFLATQHPFWTRLKAGKGQARSQYGHGARVFQNGVDYVKKNLL